MQRRVALRLWSDLGDALGEAFLGTKALPVRGKVKLAAARQKILIEIPRTQLRPKDVLTEGLLRKEG